ncbi:MAG TPA: hypothetical protein VH741_02620, partial [Candidatus Limnocylindrales bacterium]
MDADVVRERTQAHCAALLEGDVGRATEDFSEQLRSNLGSIVGQWPLPLTEAAVESVEAGGSGIVAVVRLVGESQTVRQQMRWKDRDGTPTVVEVSHVVDHV